MPRRRPSTLLTALVLLVFAGCDDQNGSRRDILRGTLVASEDGRPLGPARVELFDLDQYEVAAIAEVGGDGRFYFRPSSDGDYVPVVSMRGRRVFGLPQPRWRLERRDTVHVVEIPLVAVEPLPDTGLFLRGFVIDAETREPIEHARVEVTAFSDPFPNWSEFRGNSNTVEAATDDDGFFELWPASQFLEIGEPEPVTPNLRVRARGYQSTVIGPIPLREIPDTLRVRLRRGEDTAAVRGRVVDFEGRPVPDIVVLSEWRGPEGLAPKLAAMGDDGASGPVRSWPSAPEVASTSARLLAPTEGVSNLDGHFLLRGLPPGRISLQAAAPVDDGFLGTIIRGVQIRADSTVTLEEDLIAVPALEHVEPADWSVVDPGDTLRWRAVEGALFYRFRVGRGDGQGLALDGVDTLLALSELGDLVVPGALYRWDVLVFASNRTQISGMDRPLVFRVSQE